MKTKWLIIALIALMIVILIAACAQEPETVVEPDVEVSEAEALIKERCSTCHSSNKVFNEDYDEAGWVEVFDDMIAKGADVSDEEKALMIEWLVARP